MDIRVTVTRIDADPVDLPEGPSARRVRRRTGIGRRSWRAVMEFLPKDRLRTHVALNQEAWASASDFLAAMQDSPAITAMLDGLPADGWLERHADWAEAEREDQARADAGTDTLLTWHRPLVRIGAVVQVLGARRFDEAVMREEFGQILVLRDEAGEATFVVAGIPQDIETRAVRALAR